MKKYYSVLKMLAMMVAALSFIACGGSDDDDNLNPKENPTDNGNGGTSDSSLSLTLDGNKLYADASYASILALKDGATGIPSTATYNDTEEKSGSYGVYTLDFCFSPFAISSVGTELTLCPSVTWKGASGTFPDVAYGATNSLRFNQCKQHTLLNGVDIFVYESGKISLHNYKIGEVQIKYDNVVLKCVEHSTSTTKRDKVVLNGICAYNYSRYK